MGDTKEPYAKIDKYICSDIDDAQFPHYYGFINDLGDWYIMQVQQTGVVRYYMLNIRPDGMYQRNWNARATLNYFYWQDQV